MADEYLVKGESLKGIADTIRTKTSTTAQISFPDGFKTAISGIKTEKPEQEKTGSASPDAAVVVTPDSGKVLSKVTIEKIPSATGSSGVTVDESDPFKAYIYPLIEEAGYISGSSTESFAEAIDAFPAKTITPGTSDQLVCPNNCYVYDIGEEGLTVKGEPNLLSGNIRSGVSIFGVSGNKNVIDTSLSSAIAASSANIISGKKCCVNGATIEGTMATVEHAEPSIAVSITGKITSQHTVSTGYITGNTTTATKQLTVASAATITPGTVNTVAVERGRYTIGEIVVKGDANLISSNIKTGVSIFGINGTYSGDTTKATFGTKETTTGEWKLQVVAETAGRVDSGEVVIEFPQAELSYINNGTSGCDIHVEGSGFCFQDDNPLTIPYYDGVVIKNVANHDDYFSVPVYADGQSEGYIPPDADYEIGTGVIQKATIASLESDCKAEYIKAGATILGVDGTYQGTDTTTSNAPTAAQILSGKECWANDTKITGTMATLTHTDPLIVVSSSGLITARHTTGTGYVVGSTTSATRQLPTAAGAIITPGTSSKTAVTSGRYTTGAISVAGDANLVASNIKSGVSIFGVTGTYKGSGGAGNTWYQHTVKFTVDADSSSDQNQPYNIYDGQIVFVSNSSVAITDWDVLSTSLYDADIYSSATAVACGGYVSPQYGSIIADGWLVNAYGDADSSVYFKYHYYQSGQTKEVSIEVYDPDAEWTTVSDTVKTLGVISPTLTTTTDSSGKVTLTITDNL